MIGEQKMPDIILVSGGFDPIHSGHIKLINDANKYGDVVVLLNSDEWLRNKKGKEFLSFDELTDSVVSGSSDFGIMAIENSIAGSIIPNYALIDNLNLNIVGECFVNINHQLMVFPGVNFNDLEIVSVRIPNLLFLVTYFIVNCPLKMSDICSESDQKMKMLQLAPTFFL